MAPKPSILSLSTFSLIFFSLFSLSSPLPSESILNAVETLSNSGHTAMSLAIQFTSDAILPPQFRSATIFSPPDSIFFRFGQPAFSLIQFHISPLAFSVESLRSLPYGAEIPTMSSGKSLTVTSFSSDDRISLNNVKIGESPIYDDGLLIIFGTENFFNPNFTLSIQIQNPSPDLACLVLKNYPKMSFGAFLFGEASETLRARGYSMMASFLDLQLLGFIGEPKLTVFAPADEVMVKMASDIPRYSSLFLRHVVPCKLSWIDLANLREGTELQTYWEGFTINVTRSNNIFMANEVEIAFPDMYYSDWLIVHGLHEILSLPKTPDEEESSEDIAGSSQFPLTMPDGHEF